MQTQIARSTISLYPFPQQLLTVLTCPHDQGQLVVVGIGPTFDLALEQAKTYFDPEFLADLLPPFLTDLISASNIACGVVTDLNLDQPWHF